MYDDRLHTVDIRSSIVSVGDGDGVLVQYVKLDSPKFEL